MVYEMGAENIDPNVIMSLVTEGGEAANAFSELETEEESKKILEMLNRVKYAFSQRNEGKIDDSGKYTQEAKDSGVTDVFSDAFKVYQNTLQKTMDVLMGQDPKTEKKNTFE